MPDNSIFVFGSNTAGRHGKGAALFAKNNHGAIYGQGEGLQGNSYGIPTKENGPGRKLITLPLKEIEWNIYRFLLFAQENPDLSFQVTRIGCGYAGYTDAQIAPFFENAPSNCTLPEEWT